MIWILTILLILVGVNILLLVFSCNDADNQAKKVKFIKPKRYIYKPNHQNAYRVIADK